MATTIEVKYFNSFWVKKIVNASDEPVWPSIPSNDPGGSFGNAPEYYPTFPNDADVTSDDNWFIEESRIRGGFNNTSVSLGVRAYLNEENNLQENRKASIIFSGVYNSRTGNNETNVFSIAESITKSLDPDFGSIQKLYASDTNLTIFQQSKVNQALIDKDALYSAEGANTPVTSINQVIGSITPYLGRFGISNNPESFAFYGFRKYFVDQNRGSVCRLSRDGITEISEYGMSDYFRDELNELNFVTQSYTIPWDLVEYSPITQTNEVEVTVSQECALLKGAVFKNDSALFSQSLPRIIDIVKNPGSPTTYTLTLDQFLTPETSGLIYLNYTPKIVGGWDNFNRNYTISLQKTPAWLESYDNYKTLSYDEESRGWVSFYNFKPISAFSTRNNFLTTFNQTLWQHYTRTQNNSNYLNFYNRNYKGNISFVVNVKPSIKKNFQTISYEGDNGWYISEFTSDYTKYDAELDSSGAPSNNYVVQRNDTTLAIPSYEAGKYTDSIGYTKRTGFDRKENLYVANLVNDTVVRPEEVIFGAQMSGIKGFYATVTIQNDFITNVQGPKELWSVNTKFVQSS